MLLIYFYFYAKLANGRRDFDRSKGIIPSVTFSPNCRFAFKIGHRAPDGLAFPRLTSQWIRLPSACLGVVNDNSNWTRILYSMLITRIPVVSYAANTGRNDVSGLSNYKDKRLESANGLLVIRRWALSGLAVRWGSSTSELKKVWRLISWWFVLGRKQKLCLYVISLINLYSLKMLLFEYLNFCGSVRIFFFEELY